ncbi:hypothetical protein CROQUDRAFT_85992 [Cronartium quercuum f. sp. fusiforme G11]|uniref:Uncharacterized protein n=1 Tax=Cronartium quercuum f. sp. fusiforme G11 TaxID=708437 RepID=A0A9P6NU23_9BASI|nr:hypothetical protein CROQUDRAFT_85992 [Cronartium quercuum f. sp. fusiforme G11]
MPASAGAITHPCVSACRLSGILRYTTAPNPHSTLSHSPITPPFTDRSPLGVSLWLALSSNQWTACCRENKIILNFQLEFGIIS